MIRTRTQLFNRRLSASLATAAALVALALPSLAAGPLPIGSAIPMADTKLLNVDGKDVTIAGQRGEKGTLVVFTCNHCPYAKGWEQRIAALGNTYAKRGIGVIAINPNDPAAFPEDDMAGMKERAAKLGLAFPYAVDATSGVARAFGASKTPEAFLFDAGGKLVYHGTIDDNVQAPEQVKSSWLRDALEAVATGKPVAVAETKSLGCSIKFRS